MGEDAALKPTTLVNGTHPQLTLRQAVQRAGNLFAFLTRPLRLTRAGALTVQDRLDLITQLAIKNAHVSRDIYISLLSPRPQRTWMNDSKLDSARQYGTIPTSSRRNSVILYG